MSMKEIYTNIRRFVELSCNSLRNGPDYKWLRFTGGFLFDDIEWRAVLDTIGLYIETRGQIASFSKEITQKRVAKIIVEVYDDWRANYSKNKTFIDYTDALSKKLVQIIENSDEKILLDNIFSNYSNADDEEKKKIESVLVKNFGF